MALPRGWKTKILRGVGAPVTQNNLALLRAWQMAEGGGTANDANWNPLNTTQDAPGASSINSVGVKAYRTPQQGLQATIRTLLNGRYGPIIEALKADARPIDTAHAIARTPWGTADGVIRVLGAGGRGVAPSPQSASVPFAGPQPKARTTLGPPQFKMSTPAPFDSINLLTDNLGKIAQGWSPQRMLENTGAGLLQSLLKPSTLTMTRDRVAAPSRPSARVTSSGAAPGPGGGWDGTYQPATNIARIGEKFGLTPTSQKRDTKMTASGLQSDHWVGSKNAYAYDLGGSVAQMDRAVQAITSRLGIPYKQGQALVGSKIENGLRYQVLYRTNVGGDHFNHIHVGVKRVG